jgi:tetratricopeptide (TPR) repeat protein
MTRPRRGGSDRQGRSGRAPQRSPAERGGRNPAADRNPRRTAAERSPAAERDSRAGLPAVPEDADPALLDRAVRAELRSLSKVNADAVAKHLVAAGQLIDTDPAQALAHARAARSRAARVAAVREAVGVAAYRAGEWAEALTELRTARRISGDPHTLPLIADVERALGRPEQAAAQLNEPDARRLDAQTRAELLIVVAGARRDLGQLDAALAVLERGGLDQERPRPGAVRLWYAYADALEAAGRREDAAKWFAASAAIDPEGELDAAERAAALL